VEICDLTPDRKNWKIWRDEANNSLRLSDKGIRTYMSKTQKQKTTPDIFVKAFPSKIAKHSYWVMLLLGDNDAAMYFVGNDGRLRVCRFHKQKWIGNYVPLGIGIDGLRTVVNGYMNLDVRKVPIPSATFRPKEAWVGGYPNDAWEDRIECLLKNDMKQ
jgi:hypothetical protein